MPCSPQKQLQPLRHIPVSQKHRTRGGGGFPVGQDQKSHMFSILLLYTYNKQYAGD